MGRRDERIGPRRRPQGAREIILSARALNKHYGATHALARRKRGSPRGRSSLPARRERGGQIDARENRRRTRAPGQRRVADERRRDGIGERPGGPSGRRRHCLSAPGGVSRHQRDGEYLRRAPAQSAAGRWSITRRCAPACVRCSIAWRSESIPTRGWPRCPRASASWSRSRKPCRRIFKSSFWTSPPRPCPTRKSARCFRSFAGSRRAASAILFISHRLDEVFEIGDRITVFRDGRKVATEAIAAVTRDRLIEMMVGRQIEEAARERSTVGAPASRFGGWSRQGVFADISFSVRRGEIVGFAGPGRIGRLRCGAFALRHRGSRRRRRARRRSDRELALAPSDDGARRGVRAGRPSGRGPLSRMDSVAQHHLADPAAGSRRWASVPRARREAEVAERYIEKLGVRPNLPSALVRNLSGGNQQKVLLSKWLATNPKISISRRPHRRHRHRRQDPGPSARRRSRARRHGAHLRLLRPVGAHRRRRSNSGLFRRPHRRRV